MIEPEEAAVFRVMVRQAREAIVWPTRSSGHGEPGRYLPSA
jgi:hypothetical protein